MSSQGENPSPSSSKSSQCGKPIYGFEFDEQEVLLDLYVKGTSLLGAMIKFPTQPNANNCSEALQSIIAQCLEKLDCLLLSINDEMINANAHGHKQLRCNAT